MTIHPALDGPTQIAKKMPSIRNLLCVRCTLPYCVSVGTGTVARDDLDSGMALQPR